MRTLGLRNVSVIGRVLLLLTFSLLSVIDLGSGMNIEFNLLTITARVGMKKVNFDVS